MTTTLSTTRAQRSLLAALLGAASFAMVSAADAQTGYGQVPGPAPVGSPGRPVNPANMSCDELKTEIKATGKLSILSGPRDGWGDTYYGPAVPQCQFYQRPEFNYVRARGGLCGIGYICVDKIVDP